MIEKRADELQPGDILVGLNGNCKVEEIQLLGPQVIIYTDTGLAINVLADEIATIEEELPV